MLRLCKEEDVMAAILVVEDEVDLCNLIRTKLEAEGHSVLQAFDGPAALSLVEVHRPHLVILDWMLPGLDGLAVCRQLRQNYLMPIIMLTARTEEIDRVLGLEVGADDYISKPFSIRELLARVRAMLRRVELDSRSSSLVSNITNGGAQFIAPSQDASPPHPGRAFSREFLLQHLWGYDYDGFDRTVDTHITRLRKKLGTVGEKIVTVWGVGYRFVA